MFSDRKPFIIGSNVVIRIAPSRPVLNEICISHSLSAEIDLASNCMGFLLIGAFFNHGSGYVRREPAFKSTLPQGTRKQKSPHKKGSCFDSYFVIA